MRSPSSAVLSGLAIATAATLVAGVVSAFAVGGGSTTASSPPPSSTATTLASGGATPTLAPGGAPSTATTNPLPGLVATTTTAPGSKATTTVAPAPPLPTATGPVGDPGQPTAQVPGTYVYDYTASSGSDTQSGALNEKVSTTSTSGGVTKQTVVDSGNASLAQNRLVEWRPAGYFETQRTFMFNGQTAQCTWNPAIQELASPLAVGKQWVLSGTCQVTIYGQALTVKLNGKASVTKKERLKVGADSVNVWVIVGSYDAVASSPTIGTFTIHDDSTDRVAARLGLLVESDAAETVSTGSSAPARNAKTHEAVRSIHPAP